MFMMVLIRYYNFPRAPSVKQKYSSDSFLGLRLSQALQLMKALLVYSSLHLLLSWACLSGFLEDCTYLSFNFLFFFTYILI